MGQPLQDGGDGKGGKKKKKKLKLGEVYKYKSLLKMGVFGGSRYNDPLYSRRGCMENSLVLHGSLTVQMVVML